MGVLNFNTICGRSVVEAHVKQTVLVTYKIRHHCVQGGLFEIIESFRCTNAKRP